MSNTVPTVKVRVPGHPNEYVIVNADDPRAKAKEEKAPQKRRGRKPKVVD